MITLIDNSLAKNYCEKHYLAVGQKALFYEIKKKENVKGHSKWLVLFFQDAIGNIKTAHISVASASLIARHGMSGNG